MAEKSVLFSIMKLSVSLRDSQLRLLREVSAQLLKRGISTFHSRLCKNDGLFLVHPAVSQALAENRPVVALESTIITHGMPYPHNLRTEGATPATVGLLQGRVHVGLSSEELDYLAQSKTSLKVSRRDLPYAISKGLCGGTTVSGTMIAAHRAGIHVFVTGAGVKSILDIGRTLEYLETQGVCVATFGTSKNFPAFFSPQSIRGGDVTPFILQKVNELTRGKSLQANIALIHNNARVGSQIACALSERMQKKTRTPSAPHAKEREKDLDSHSTIVVIGDILSRMGQRPLFISAIGTDSHSDAVLNYCRHMNTSGVARLKEQRTATYCAVITESGDLSLGLGDMDIHQQITEHWKALAYTSPNLAELCTINKALGLPTPAVLPSSVEEVLRCAMALTRPLLDHLQCVVVTLGAMGVLLCGEHNAGSVDLQPRRGTRKGRLCAVHYSALALTADETVNVSGAGDSLAGGILAGMFQSRDTHSCVRMGLLAARLSLASPHPICTTLTTDSVDPNKVQPPQPWPQPNLLWLEE
ncbi:unnamed protein product [Coregonus sp. 'balchen']|nr:unnamed protein product [Coregonus sp. 'balchen']